MVRQSLRVNTEVGVCDMLAPSQGAVNSNDVLRVPLNYSRCIKKEWVLIVIVGIRFFGSERLASSGYTG